MYRLFRDVGGAVPYAVEVRGGIFGTSRVLSPRGLGCEGVCGTWRAPSPTDLRREGEFRDVEGAVSYGFEVCGGLRGVEGVVAYGFGACGFGNESAGYDSLKSLSIKS